jgi:hypothetical protein
MAVQARRRRVVTKTKSTVPIKKLSQRPKFGKFLFYSEPGGGKSTLAASSVEVGPTLIVNADGPDALESARAVGYDPDVWDVEGYKDLERVYEFTRHNPGRHQFVWLDGITLYQDSNIQYILQEVRVRSPHRDPDVPDKPEYLREQMKTLKFIRHMRALPINFGITAHVMQTEDDEGTVMYLPSIQGKQGVLSSKVCGYMSVVGRLTVVRVKGKDGKIKRSRRLVTQFDGKYYAKDRFDVLGEYVPQPTMAKIMSSINGGKQK